MGSTSGGHINLRRRSVGKQSNPGSTAGEDCGRAVPRRQGVTQLGCPGDVEATAAQRGRPLDQPEMPAGEHHGISDGYDEIVPVAGIEGTYLGIALLDQQP
jgi:hypothetical protein